MSSKNTKAKLKTSNGQWSDRLRGSSPVVPIDVSEGNAGAQQSEGAPFALDELGLDLQPRIKEALCCDDVLEKIKNVIMEAITQQEPRITPRSGRREGRPNPIIVRFSAYNIRQRVYDAKTKLKGSDIFVQEDLTPFRRDLMNRAMKMPNVKRVRTNDGRITVWRSTPDGKEKRVLVRTVDDLALLDVLTKGLLKRLFHDEEDPYNRQIRPTINETTAIHLKMQLFVARILELNERFQLLKANVWLTFDWVDEFLTWNPEEYEGVENIKISSDFIWLPDIVLYNNAGTGYEPYLQNKLVKIYHTGHVNWAFPHIIRASCDLNIANFPFDTQQCDLKFGPWQHDCTELVMEGAGDETVFRSDGEWDMVGLAIQTNQFNYPDDPGVRYYDVTFTIKIRRRSMHYVFNLLLPCILIASITLLGFLLPVDSGEKVSLGVTVLLSLTVFLLLIAESMPPSSVVPIIGHYYISTMALVSFSLLLTVTVLNLHHRGPYCNRAPRWLRVFVLGTLARFLRLQPAELRQRKHELDRKSSQIATMNDKLDHLDEGRSSVDKTKEPNRISNGNKSRDESSERKEDVVALMLRLVGHVRYIREHYQDVTESEDVQNEWKQIALVVDRVFAVFYVIGMICTVTILFFNLA
ncbi:neuronal acetylcholine receptor subunit beta-2-like [Diadema antillarum]|uniref:neuronal acetylcholine receptor subunit beta-2-like n=1 Tax=Diadema antillarum TaxID=105358 RepID=UPI003A8914C5